MRGGNNSSSLKTARESRFNRTHKSPAGCFEVRHFAGVVSYDSTGFVEKNRDKLHDHLDELLQVREYKILYLVERGFLWVVGICVMDILSESL